MSHDLPGDDCPVLHRKEGSPVYTALITNITGIPETHLIILVSNVTEHPGNLTVLDLPESLPVNGSCNVAYLWLPPH
jgi:hypothetical protein